MYHDEDLYACIYWLYDVYREHVRFTFSRFHDHASFGLDSPLYGPVKAVQFKHVSVVRRNGSV